MFVVDIQLYIVLFEGIASLALSFRKKSSFTFKLVYSENMMEIVNGIELNRYVVQVIEVTTENFASNC